MREIVKKIFLENGYDKLDINLNNAINIDVFSLTDHKKKNFSIVTELKPSDAIEAQNEIFEKCKDAVLDPAFDKNCYLIILYNSSNENLVKIKKEVLSAEEDEYIFKKEVIHYKTSQLDEFKRELPDDVLLPFINGKIIDSKVFNDYKQDINDSWQALLYRVVCKLPFIPIETAEGENLVSLVKKNQSALNKKGLDKLDMKLFDIIDKLSAEELKEKDEYEVYSLLEPIFDEE